MKRKKVLIIGGGGVFGAIPSYFLSEANVRDIRNNVDFIAGTSIGGIMALYLAQGKPAKDLYVDFNNNVESIFEGSFWRNLNPCSSKYSADNIEKFLKDHIKGTFSDLRMNVIIPVLNFRDERPKVFDNIVRDSDLKFDSWKIARMTSAAPTYFPPYGPYIGIDGGIIENLPIMTTLSAIKSKTLLDFKDLDVMVLGTGYKQNKKRTLSDVENYGNISWLNNLLIPYVTKSNEITSDYWAKNMGLHSYEYFNPVKIDGDMDDASLVTSKELEKSCEPFKDEFINKWEKFIK